MSGEVEARSALAVERSAENTYKRASGQARKRASAQAELRAELNRWRTLRRLERSWVWARV